MAMSEAELANLADIFSLFDFQQDGTIALDDFGTVLRAFGKNCTEEQIQDFINKYVQDGSSFLNFPAVVKIVTENRDSMREPYTEEEALDHLRAFDMYRDDHITAADFFNMLNKMGEPMTQEDIYNLLREFPPDGDNKLRISEFVSHMVQTS